MVEYAIIDTLLVDRLLSSCGIAATNIFPLGGGHRFACFVGPATAAAGGVEEAREKVRGAGYGVDFVWGTKAAKADGFGVCFFDIRA